MRKRWRWRWLLCWQQRLWLRCGSSDGHSGNTGRTEQRFSCPPFAFVQPPGQSPVPVFCTCLEEGADSHFDLAILWEHLTGVLSSIHKDEEPTPTDNGAAVGVTNVTSEQDAGDGWLDPSAVNVAVVGSKLSSFGDVLLRRHASAVLFHRVLLVRF